MARVENLNWLEEIRTYQELLFAVKGLPSCPMDAEKAAEMIVKQVAETAVYGSIQSGPFSHTDGIRYIFRLHMKRRSMRHSQTFRDFSSLYRQGERHQEMYDVDTADRFLSSTLSGRANAIPCSLIIRSKKGICHS